MLANLADQFILSFSGFWDARNVRERAMLAVATLVAALGLVWFLLIDPALTARAQLNKSLPSLHQQVAKMQALAKEAAGFSASNTAPPPPLTKESIEAALAQHGLKPQSVIVNSEFAKVQLASTSFAEMLNWLEDMQKALRASVMEANIVALAQPDMVNATFTLRQPKNE